MNPPESGYKKVIFTLIYSALIVSGLVFMWKHLLLVLIPFVFSWILSYYLQTPVLFLKKKLHIPKKLSALILILTVTGIISASLYFLLDKIFFELYSIYEHAAKNSDLISESVISFFNSIEHFAEKFPLSRLFEKATLGEKIRETSSDALMTVLKEVIEKIPSLITDFISLIPKLFIFIIILIFSSYYLTADFYTVNNFVLIQFNEKATSFFIEFKRIFFDVISKFIKAYLIIFFVTFIITFAGLALIGIDFALVIALIIAIVDILPILGSGTVLIPWSIICLITKDYYLSLSLILLYLVITFVCQMIQPKIIGSLVGLHPLVSILSMFIGFALIGVFGMFIFPILIIILKTMNDKGSIKLWKKTAPKNISHN